MTVLNQSLLLYSVQFYLFLPMIIIVFLFYFQFQDEIVTPRDTTMTFTCFVLFDMFNALSCRSMVSAQQLHCMVDLNFEIQISNSTIIIHFQTKSILSLGLFTNRALSYSIGGCILCQLLVIYFSPLQSIFQTESLTLFDIIFLTLLCSSVLVADEVYKACYRRWSITRSHSAVSCYQKYRTSDIQLV